MKDKILFWLGDALYRFGIVKPFQENFDCELYAILDVDIDRKNFFQKQKMVKFDKIWYYRDNVHLNNLKKPNLEYLKKFEEKYNLKLWNLIYSERYFYKYNLYDFSHDELLCLLEQECDFFERTIDEIQPDFLIIGTTDLHHNHLLYELCRSKGIQVLMLGGSRFGFREMVCKEPDKINGLIQPNKNQFPKIIRSYDELQNYLNAYDNTKQISKFTSSLKVSKISQLTKFFKLFFIYTRKKYQNQFESYGMTKTKMLKYILFSKFSRKKVSFFVNHNLDKNFEDSLPFIYFPLHTEPERSLSIAAPYYTNQIEVITNIAKSIPVEYTLLVKDHPGMAFKPGGGRKISFYKSIMELPNVKLVHPLVKQNDILRKCSLVITISGTAGLEAAFFNKPSITLIETLYSHLPSVTRIHSFDELPTAIRTSLHKKVDTDSLNDFVDFIDNNSFEIDRKIIASDFKKRFVYRKINEAAMESFLQDHKNSFQQIALEYINKIHLIKKIQSN